MGSCGAIEKAGHVTDVPERRWGSAEVSMAHAGGGSLDRAEKDRQCWIWGPGRQNLGENFFPSSRWPKEAEWKTRVQILERASPTSRPLSQC